MDKRNKKMDKNTEIKAREIIKIERCFVGDRQIRRSMV